MTTTSRTTFRCRGPALRSLAALAFTAALSSCSTAYYGALEQFGIEKRDILVDRVEDARDAQNDAKEQFSSALDRYRSVVTVDGGDLEETYDAINSEYERSEQRAQAVTDRIDSVEQVAEDLFEEWEDELADYSDAGLRRRSESLLRDTRSHYQQVMSAMRRAEGAMYPVLTLFQDQVLVLRHNLNARAIGALENELGSIERATADLIAEMERAIAEASAFIDSMA
ncbi:MAG: DUF2959 domain-containing protein [Gammaproteobacteria bacterium]|nr:DUF2959 domain-containing protein [Gammaproteobacteria bacterium]